MRDHGRWMLLIMSACLLTTAAAMGSRNGMPAGYKALKANGQGARRAESDSTSIDELHQTPVFQILQAAQNSMQSHGSSLQHPGKGVQLQPQCQLQESDLHEVTAAAVAFATAPRQPDGPDEARDAAMFLRLVMHRAWMKILQHFTQAVHVAGSTSSSKCKSVGLNPRPARRTTSTKADDTRDSTALVLVLSDWGSLERLLKLYAINIFTIWSYARQHGYGLELYVHDEPLPHSLPLYYVKVLGIEHAFNQLGYQHALYLDFDTFTSPHTAVPLELLYDEWPGASLLMNAEDNMGAGVMMWRNTPDAAFLLQAWWDVGSTGCCPTFTHDQTALKQMMLAYMANVTGEAWIYGRSMQQRFKLPTLPSDIDTKNPKVLTVDHWPLRVDTLRKLRPLLQEAGSAVGFVGLDAQQQFGRSLEGSYSGVVLHNCMAMWGGCVPRHTPSLLYHTGHWVMVDFEVPLVAERLLRSVRGWVHTLDLQHMGTW